MNINALRDLLKEPCPACGELWIFHPAPGGLAQLSTDPPPPGSCPVRMSPALDGSVMVTTHTTCPACYCPIVLYSANPEQRKPGTWATPCCACGTLLKIADWRDVYPAAS